MKFTIDRSRWLRGEGWAASRLLRPGDGKMCCMGFFAKAIGCTDDDILDARLIEDLGLPNSPMWETTISPEAGRLIKALGDLGCLYAVNDVVEVAADAAASREARITAIFAKYSIEVEFVDGVEKPT